MPLKYAPRKDFVLVKMSNIDTNAKGIALPQRSATSLMFHVVAVGDQVKNLKEGDRIIIYAKAGQGDYYELPGDQKLMLLREEFIAATVTETADAEEAYEKIHG